MAIKKSEIYSSLWESCNALRGGMDASQYKDYVLTMLFVKYVSDKYKDEPYGDVVIPKGGSFDDMVKLECKDNIGEGINKIIAKLAEANEKLMGTITKVSFNDSDKLGKGKEMVDKLSKLIKIFRDEKLDFSKNKSDGDDLIGDAYEYLMRNFATESGKSKGQFYTPAEVSRILAKVVGISNEKDTKATVYDPACGSGSLLIRALAEAPVELSGYGQEKETTTANLAIMNTVLHGKATATIKAGNTFSEPQYFEKDDDSTLRRFDYIVANPPFSLKNWTDGLKEYDRFNGYGQRPPEKNGDYAWAMHIIKSLKSKGKAAVILPHGVLFRGNAEGEIRKNIIEKGYIKGIIGLPANLFYGTGIPASIIIFDMEDAKNRKEIFMIDASRGYIKDGNKNRLREEDVYKIVKTFNERITDDSSYARLVSYDEIINKNDYNLNLSRYIERNEDEDIQNLDGHINGGIPNTDIDNLHIYFDLFKKLKNKLFKEKRKGFSELKVTKDDIRKTIYQDEEFSKFADVIDTAFKDFQTKTYKKLNNLSIKDDAKKLIIDISEQILKSFADISLIDKYDVYEVLMEYYNDVMADDIYLIIKDGYEAASEIENIYGTKKEEQDDGKKKEVIDKSKIKGYEGKIIPKSLIIDEYFKKENDLINDTEVIVENLKSEIETIVEEADDDSSINDVLNDSGKLDTKKLKKIKDNDDELKKLYDKNNEISEKSKVLKELKKELEDKVKEKYKELSLDELKTLTVDKKWYKNIYEGIDNLYMNISHNLTNKVIELADRYDMTLSEIEDDVSKIEKKVKNHIKELMED